MGYIFIETDMVRVLGLKGNTLLVYALINGFSREGQGIFTGSISFVAETCGISRNTAISCLQSLTKSGYIVRHEETVNGVKAVSYAVNHKLVMELCGGSAEIALGSAKIGLGGSAEIAPNTTNSNNIKEIISKDIIKKVDESDGVSAALADSTMEEGQNEGLFAADGQVVGLEGSGAQDGLKRGKAGVAREECEEAVRIYNAKCRSFSSARGLAGDRLSKMKSRIAEMTKMGDGDWRKVWNEVCEKFEACDFAKGSNWACFGWLIKNEENFVKVLEWGDRRRTQAKAVDPTKNCNDYWSEVQFEFEK